MAKLYFSAIPFDLSSIILRYLHELIHSERLWPVLVDIERIYVQSFWIHYPYAIPLRLTREARHSPQVQTEWIFETTSIFKPITWYNLGGDICGHFYERGLYIYPRDISCLDSIGLIDSSFF